MKVNYCISYCISKMTSIALVKTLDCLSECVYDNCNNRRGITSPKNEAGVVCVWGGGGIRGQNSSRGVTDADAIFDLSGVT